MTKTTHTPGPWVAMPWFNHQRAPICTRDESGTVTLLVATVEDFHDSPDARLIAAAPELLAALIDLLPHAERNIADLNSQMVGTLYLAINEEKIRRAEAAIAKAKGID